MEALDDLVKGRLADVLEAYLSLFAAAFLAATLLPFYSEILFAGLQGAGYDPWALWLFATAGNTLGACVNWVLGRFSQRLVRRRWFPFSERGLRTAERWFARYGVWSLLFAWAPIGGDALTFVAGLMRVRFAIFVALTGLGKGARYLLVLGLVSGTMGAG